MLSLFVSGCNDYLEKTCEFRYETFFVCVFCETSWQQTMGGQRRCKHSMEMGGRMLFDEYKKGSSRAKKRFVFIVEIVAHCVEGGAYKVWWLLFDFCYASDYIIVGFCVLVNVRLYKGLMLWADDT